MLTVVRVHVAVIASQAAPPGARLRVRASRAAPDTACTNISHGVSAAQLARHMQLGASHSSWAMRQPCTPRLEMHVPAAAGVAYNSAAAGGGAAGANAPPPPPPPKPAPPPPPPPKRKHDGADDGGAASGGAGKGDAAAVERRSARVATSAGRAAGAAGGGAAKQREGGASRDRSAPRTCSGILPNGGRCGAQFAVSHRPTAVSATCVHAFHLDCLARALRAAKLPDALRPGAAGWACPKCALLRTALPSA